MHLTKTLHPPGGATALIAVAGSDQVHALGLKFVLMPVGVGVLVETGVAVGVFVGSAPPLTSNDVSSMKKLE